MQAHRQGAFHASLADGGLHVREQHWSVEGENGGVGVVGGADQADDSGGDGADGAGAVVEFEHPHTVKIIGHGFCLRSDWDDSAQAAARVLVGRAPGVVRKLTTVRLDKNCLDRAS
ncbi:hypothetical protein D3C72_1337100 [compost metagenome]